MGKVIYFCLLETLENLVSGIILLDDCLEIEYNYAQ